MELQQALKYYLDCGVKFNTYSPFENDTLTLIGIKEVNGFFYLIDKEGETLFDEENCKPILYPLDLTKPIWYDGKEIVPIEKLCEGHNWRIVSDFVNDLRDYIEGYKSCPFWILEQLFKWRIDVFGLIEQGLAIPVTEEFNPYK